MGDRALMSTRQAIISMGLEAQRGPGRDADVHHQIEHCLWGLWTYPILSAAARAIVQDLRFQVPRRVLHSWLLGFPVAGSLSTSDRKGWHPALGSRPSFEGFPDLHFEHRFHLQTLVLPLRHTSRG